MEQSEFSLQDLESSPEYQKAAPEDQQTFSKAYVAKFGPGDALKTYKETIDSPEFGDLKPEQQDLFQQKYVDFYGLKATSLPTQKTSFLTDVKDIAAELGNAAP